MTAQRDVTPFDMNPEEIAARGAARIAHRWFDQVISTCGVEYIEQVHDEYARLCSAISARTIASADENPLIPEDMNEDEDPCDGTGVVECWNPGGPCPSEQRASGCELCGPCRTCDESAPTQGEIA